MWYFDDVVLGCVLLLVATLVARDDESVVTGVVESNDRPRRLSVMGDELGR